MSVFRDLLMNIKKEPYLLNDGVEYINSNFMPLNHSCEIKFALFDNTNSQPRTCAYQMSYKYYYPITYDNDSGKVFSAYVDGDFIPWSKTGYTITLMETLDTNKHTVLYNDTNSHNLYFDGEFKKQMTNMRTFNTSYNSYILIFAGCTYYNNNPSNIEVSKFKLYSLKFTNNTTGQVDRWYVPAINNGVACLYEKIQGQYYYGNNGGNNFVYGED